MYGDEKHSSVLMNEIDGFRIRFEQLRSFMNRGFSRTEYGRSARGSKRQPRPQIFRDDDEDTPATIFRVVTETSIKVGDPVTKPMTAEIPTSTYESVTTGFDATTLEETSFVTTVSSSTITSSQTSKTEPSTTEAIKDSTYTTTTEVPSTTTTDLPSTTETTPETTTRVFEDLPVAMERLGYEDGEDYDYEPGRKSNSAVLQNSVEEKIKYKQESNEVKRNDPGKYNEDTSIYEVSADDTTEENVREETATEKAQEEEIPRRGM